jgi:hypothetical protein
VRISQNENTTDTYISTDLGRRFSRVRGKVWMVLAGNGSKVVLTKVKPELVGRRKMIPEFAAQAGWCPPVLNC